MKSYPLVITGEFENHMNVSEKIMKQLLVSDKSKVIGLPFGEDILDIGSEFEFVEKLEELRKISSGIKTIWESSTPLSVNIYLNFKGKTVSSIYIIEKQYDFKEDNSHSVDLDFLYEPFPCPITPIKESTCTPSSKRRKSFYVSPQRQSYAVPNDVFHPLLSQELSTDSISPGEIRGFNKKLNVSKKSTSSKRTSAKKKLIFNVDVSEDFILPECFKKRRADEEDWVTNYRIVQEKELWNSYYQQN